jgi:1-phosphofructokinase family hexose kinase
MLIAGPNLTTDRSLTIDRLTPGEVLRFTSARVTPGGKGVNVLRVADALGFPATLVALSPGRTGRAVVGLIEDQGLEVMPVPVRGEVRAASIISEPGGRVTVLNEPGPPVSREEWEAYERTIGERLSRGGFLLCIGSAPPGSPADAYARLVELARDRGARAAVDAAGDLLEAALEARPDLVTPNLGEAEGVLFGPGRLTVDDSSPEVRARTVEAAAGLVGRGAPLAVVTSGRAGVAVADPSGARWIDAPSVRARNPIGAGDALVAGLVGSLERGRDLDQAVAWGLAAAGAAVETDVPGELDPDRVAALVEAGAAKGTDG